MVMLTGNIDGEIQYDFRYELSPDMSAIFVEAYMGTEQAGSAIWSMEDGQLEIDVMSDGCSNLPDDSGWPDPPQDLVEQLIP